jgi:hypothetical protein
VGSKRGDPGADFDMVRAYALGRLAGDELGEPLTEGRTPQITMRCRS